MAKTILTVNEAAARAGMTADELMVSRARGLSPGTLGFKEYPGGPLLWRASELLEAPAAELTCSECGFRAKSSSGLATHRRKHG